MSVASLIEDLADAVTHHVEVLLQVVAEDVRRQSHEVAKPLLSSTVSTSALYTMGRDTLLLHTCLHMYDCTIRDEDTPTPGGPKTLWTPRSRSDKTQRNALNELARGPALMTLAITGHDSGIKHPSQPRTLTRLQV